VDDYQCSELFGVHIGPELPIDISKVIEGPARICADLGKVAPIVVSIDIDLS
jgi:hypothetical protein